MSKIASEERKTLRIARSVNEQNNNRYYKIIAVLSRVNKKGQMRGCEQTHCPNVLVWWHYVEGDRETVEDGHKGNSSDCYHPYCLIGQR
ncbi:MAG: hypothetical protein ABII72_00155 [Parcubacteria group bacterium]